MDVQARSLVDGAAFGELLVSHTSLSFWGGINPETGIIVDQHHPLCGECITGRLFAIPSGRGSCTGSGVLLELLLRKRAPAALIFQHVEQILTLGVMVARAMFERSIPVLVISAEAFTSLRSGSPAVILGSVLTIGHAIPPTSLSTSSTQMPRRTVRLTTKDKRMLEGAYGPATKLAMTILVDVAEMQAAETFLDVTQAHIDACIYIGPASLTFAERFMSLGAKFAVPTTLNSISIDQRRWREIGMNAAIAQEAHKLAEAYMAMGAVMSFTCAPYLLDTAPKSGEDIGWAESNAVVFANSVLGARTQKYPDFLDVAIALTGRAPAAGCHLQEQRLPRLRIDVRHFPGADDAYYPLLGYHVGKLAGPDIPLITGLEHADPSISDLKAFGAAFATTASAPMFHIQGLTPEALNTVLDSSKLPCFEVTNNELIDCWRQLNTATDPSVGLISLGNPHFSLEEFAKLAALLTGRKKHTGVELVVTTSRAVAEQASQAGYIEVLEYFGGSVINDTCWCMLDEPVIPLNAKNIMTNSAKYAHYAPGMVHRKVHFGSLSRCIEAACNGVVTRAPPVWLTTPTLELQYTF
ncbi:hypothetical protein PV11_03226 [Exophiala sideris]|uniref:Aconitase X catalytic domain-containing protein n=1 Tax=Exophiala sideris TaxID=1016849 RepID=A0A0D1XHN6_9EURO|nr:hypothetical protein PV11_03226 [Exophiala sideris]